LKKVLVITYYWPPAGGGGVQRWLKLSKYLPEFGWQPVIYAPENADYPLLDDSRVAEVPAGVEVIRQRILEPRRLYGVLAGDSSRRSQEADEIFHRTDEQRSWKQNVAVWLRGNLLVPDARVLWVRPSVKFLTRRLKTHPVDAIVTTGPPHSMHLIGEGLRRRFGVRWIADFRDPWTEIEFFGDMKLTGISESRHRRLERRILNSADQVVTVSPTWASRLSDRGGRASVVTNGFDEDDFRGEVVVSNERFRVTHVGSLSMDRNPTALWEYLGHRVNEDPVFRDDLEIEFLGRVDPAVVEAAASKGLGQCLRVRGYVSHREAVDAMRRSSIQLLLINKDADNAPGRIPGKLFEYLAAERPILLIGPKGGDAAAIVRDTGSGEVCDYQDADAIESVLSRWYKKFTDRALDTARSGNITSYSHRSLAKKYADLLESG